MQGTLVHMPGNGDIGMVIAIVFVDNDQISHFHQPFFNALQIIAATGNLQRDKTVHHAGDFRFRLPDANRFDNHYVITRCFA